MNGDRTGRWLAAFVIASLALHALMFGSLGRRARAARKAPTLVTMEVVQRPPPASPPPPRPVPPRPVRRAIAVAAPARPTPAPPAPGAPPPVADFTGVTLTNDGPSATGWASAVANGQPSHAPTALPRPTPATTPGPAIVAPADLRRPPEAPGLDEALARNYPEEQRRQGLTGVAVVRARILADGRVRPLHVVSATAPAFAEACKRTLVDSRWSQPLDREARPCATDISYTCRFELGQ